MKTLVLAIALLSVADSSTWKRQTGGGIPACHQFLMECVNTHAPNAHGPNNATCQQMKDVITCVMPNLPQCDTDGGMGDYLAASALQLSRPPRNCDFSDITLPQRRGNASGNGNSSLTPQQCVSDIEQCTTAMSASMSGTQNPPSCDDVKAVIDCFRPLLPTCDQGNVMGPAINQMAAAMSGPPFNCDFVNGQHGAQCDTSGLQACDTYFQANICNEDSHAVIVQCAENVLQSCDDGTKSTIMGHLQNMLDGLDADAIAQQCGTDTSNDTGGSGDDAEFYAGDI